MEHTSGHSKVYSPGRVAGFSYMVIMLFVLIGMISGSYMKQQTMGVFAGSVIGMIIGFIITIVIGKSIAKED